uniref:hypothetical protein n=1 Tax=Candidatus Frankia nodulisporulans TaxID=2060052 RepID=UPI00370437A9
MAELAAQDRRDGEVRQLWRAGPFGEGRADDGGAGGGEGGGGGSGDGLLAAGELGALAVGQDRESAERAARWVQHVVQHGLQGDHVRQAAARDPLEDEPPPVAAGDRGAYQLGEMGVGEDLVVVQGVLVQGELAGVGVTGGLVDLHDDQLGPAEAVMLDHGGDDGRGPPVRQPPVEGEADAGCGAPLFQRIGRGRIESFPQPHVHAGHTRSPDNRHIGSKRGFVGFSDGPGYGSSRLGTWVARREWNRPWP